MSARVSLPASLSAQQATPSTLQRSGEGVTFANRTPTTTISPDASRTLSQPNTTDQATNQATTSRPVITRTRRDMTPSATLSPNQETAESMSATGSSITPDLTNNVVQGETPTVSAEPVKTEEGWGFNFDMTSLLAIIIVPIIVWIILYTIKFNFTCDIVNQERVINTSKLILWTIIISIIIWLIIWVAYSYWSKGKAVPPVSA